MKSIFTILAVLLFSLPLRAVDGKGSLEIDQNNGDSKATCTGCFYSGLQEFSHAAGNSLLYLGTGGMAAGALFSYASERYAKPFIFGSLACLAGGVFFKGLERTVNSVWGINRSQLDKRQIPSINPQPGDSVTAEIQAVTNVDVESATKTLPVSVEPATVRANDSRITAEDPLAQHNLSSTVGAPVSDNDQDPKDDDSDTFSDDWDAAKVPVSLVSKGIDYSLGNAMQYIGRVTTPYLSWLYGKKNTN